MPSLGLRSNRYLLSRRLQSSRKDEVTEMSLTRCSAPEEKKGGPPSRSKVIFLSLLGAGRRLLRHVLVIVAGQAMGGWKLSNPEEEEPVATEPDTIEKSGTNRYRDNTVAW